MTILRTLATLALALPLLAQTRSYQPFRYAQGSIVAPMPGGGLALGVSDQEDGRLLVLNPNGKVTASRSLGPWVPAFLTTTAAGEVYTAHRKARDTDCDLVTKLRRDLSPVWTRRLLALDGTTVSIKSGAATRDRGVVLVGRLSVATFAVKLDAEGNVVWTTVLDRSGQGERLEVIRETADGFVAAGSADAAWLVRLDRDGQVLWQRMYPPMRQFDAIAVSATGEITAVGDAVTRPGVAKISAGGEPLWAKIANVPGYGHAIVETPVGHVAAVSTGRIGSLQLLALKGDGDLLWQRKVEGEPMLLYDRDASLLAMRRDRLVFTAGFNSDRVPVLDVDPATGNSDCRWLSADGALAVDDAPPLRVEKPSIEISAPGMVTEPAPLALPALNIGAVAETCPPFTTTRLFDEPAPLSREVAFVLRDDDADRKRYVALLEAKDVDGLEEEVNRLLQAGPSRDPFRPNIALYVFYGSLRSTATLPEEHVLSLLRQWVTAYPQSAAAKIALAYGLYEASHERRGSGYWSDVTATGAAKYRKLLGEAGEVLSAAGEPAHRNPQYWQMRIVLAAEDDGEDVRQLASQALAIHRDPELARGAAKYLQPKWGGSEEELFAFADEMSQLLREQYGDALYAWLAYQFDTDAKSERYAFDWPRVQKGYEAVMQRWPHWLPAYHHLAMMAWRRKDRAVLRKLFERDELAWFKDAGRIWYTRSNHENAREFALKEEKPHDPPPVPRVVPAPPPAARLTAAQAARKKLFNTPVFLKIGRKRIEAKIVSMNQGEGRTSLFIGLPQKLDARVKVAGVEVVDSAGIVLAVIRERTTDTHQGMEEILQAEPTAVAGLLP